MNIPRAGQHGRIISLIRSMLYCLLAAGVLLAAAAYTLVTLYLPTPQAATKLSALLSNTIDLPVTVSGITLQGDTLQFSGISVGNPAGFTGKNLVAIRHISVAPNWKGLLTGQRALRLLDVTAAEITLSRGSDGVWNFEPLRKKFSGGKGGAELVIDDLRVRDGSITVNGTPYRRISLELRHVASKGSAGSTADISFADLAGNRYRVSGSFRAGAVPEAELSLEAPSLSLAGLTGTNGQFAMTSGTGSLRGKAALHDGLVRTELAATVTQGSVRLRNGTELPLSGSLQAFATYGLKSNELTVDQVSLALDHMLEMAVSGHVTDLKHDPHYDLTLGIRRLDLERLVCVLPAVHRKALQTRGIVTAEKVRISGSRSEGVVLLEGAISLRELAVTQGNRLLVNGIGTALQIATVTKSIRIEGEIVQQPANGTPLLEKIRAPYRLILDRRLKPHTIDLPRITAQLLGAPLTGSVAVRPAQKAPFSLSLQIPAHRLRAVSFGGFGIEGGSAAVSLDLSGAGLSSFSGSATLSLADLTGTSNGEPFSLGSSSVTAAIKKDSAHRSVSGNAAFDRASFRNMAAHGRCDFAATDGILRLEQGTGSVADTIIGFSRLTAVLPKKGTAHPPTGYPLDVQLAGGAVSRSGLALRGLSAELHGSYGKADGRGSLSGHGTIAAAELLWHDRNIGALRADVSLTRARETLALSGVLLGGTMTGSATIHPDIPGTRADFDLSLTEIDVTRLAELTGQKGQFALSGGHAAVFARGNYDRSTGVSGRVQGEAKNIAVAGKGGRELLGGAGLTFDASLAKGNITLTDALFLIGEGASLQLQGEVSRAFSPQRDGMITGRLSHTPLARIIDPLANGLPRILQEAIVSGTIAAESSLSLQNGRALLQGTVQLYQAGIDAGAKKLLVAGIDGNIPFSLGFPRRYTASPEQSIIVQRPLYGQQLALFSQEAQKGSLLTIGSIAFGPLKFTDTAVRVTAADGIIEALSFSSSLTTGKILGTGYVAFSQGASYGGDLLVNNLSLEQLCALFPNLKGYVSGRVDGLAMFEGQGGGIGALNGYTYFWTRPGDGEKMLVSREFLQKLAGKNLQGFFFRNDRPFDTGEVMASLESGYLTFDILDIEHTNMFAIRDLKVSVTETQNRIALDHLLDSISQAVSRGKGASGTGAADKEPSGEAAPPPAFKWNE